MNVGNSQFKVLFFITILIGSFFRLYNLGTNPAGLHADEALTGYTTYSILKTGKDLLGTNNIISFHDINRGEGTTYPALLSWVMLPFMAMLGLEVYVDRLPSALMGIASIVLLFAITRELTKNNKIALIAAFFIAINPWAIHISRQGLLQSISLFLVLLGTYLFFIGSRKPKFILLAMTTFGLSLFAYDAPRLFLPLMLIPLSIYHWHTMHKTKKFFVLGILIFSLFYSVFLYQMLFQNEAKEYTSSSLINMSQVSDQVNVERTQSEAPLWLSKIFHNKVTVVYSTVVTNYVNVLSVNWMYVNGPAIYQMSTGKQGQFHIFGLPFAIIGFYFLYQHHRKSFIILLLWFFFAILPGALSSSSSPNRLSLAIPIPLIFSASGFYVMLLWLKSLKPIMRNLSIGIIIMIMGIFTCSYLVTYFFAYPVYASEFWSKQQNDAIQYAIQNNKNYNGVYLNGNISWASQYAYFTKLDPHIFQNAILKPKKYKSIQVYKFDSIYFGTFSSQLTNINCAHEFFPENSLIIISDDILEGEKPIKRFYDPGNLRAVFKAIETKTPEISECKQIQTQDAVIKSN